MSTPYKHIVGRHTFTNTLSSLKIPVFHLSLVSCFHKPLDKSWMKVFRIISEFRILKESHPQNAELSRL